MAASTASPAMIWWLWYCYVVATIAGSIAIVIAIAVASVIVAVLAMTAAI